MNIPMLNSIALAETGDVEVLLRVDKILRIAEECANAEIYEIKPEIVDQSGEALWHLGMLSTSLLS